MNTEHIREFIYVVETGSFLAASKLTYSDKTQVSRHISKLENELGCKLFNRQANCISLTSNGEYFYSECKKLIRDFDILSNNIKVTDNPKLIYGRITVSTYSKYNFVDIGNIYNEFLDIHKNTKVFTTKINDHDFVRLLNNYETDIALEIYTPEFMPSNINSMVIGTIDSNLICSDFFSISEVKKILSGELKTECYVSSNTSLSDSFELVNYFLNTGSMEFVNIEVIDDFNVLLENLNKKIGVTIVPQNHSQIFFNDKGLKKIPLKEVPIKAFWNANLRNPLVSDLIMDIKAMFAKETTLVNG